MWTKEGVGDYRFLKNRNCINSEIIFNYSFFFSDVRLSMFYFLIFIVFFLYFCFINYCFIIPSSKIYTSNNNNSLVVRRPL